MYNVFRFQKKKDLDDLQQIKQIKDEQLNYKHKEQREMLSQQYKKRVANFIKEMAENPIVENDQYTNIQEDKIKLNKKKFLNTQINQDRNNLQELLHPASFRFQDKASDRLQKSKIQNEFLDIIPNPNMNQTFHKMIRQRNQEKELNGTFRFRASNSIDRVIDNASTYYIQQDVHHQLQMKQQVQQLNRMKGTEKSQITDRQSISTNTARQIINPKDILPSLHQKTHFKGATTFFMNTQDAGILNFNNNDHQTESIFQDLNAIAIRKGIITQADESPKQIAKPNRRYKRLINKSMEINSRNKVKNQNLGLLTELNNQGHHLNDSINKSVSIMPRDINKTISINDMLIENSLMIEEEDEDSKIYDSVLSASNKIYQRNSYMNKYKFNDKAEQKHHKLNLDYNKIHNITRNVLKSCNVLRKKNLNTFQNTNDLFREYTMNTIQ
ncbi:UNKNOWN [Stylonychia lemnae]|uniref:Uncharacterized protein n=1 Tax=Stylonychia lemnae TaxID=5949 RepID=A0A078AZ03_STYLE|nr:UNKNOWN [Stylonychia lemnae]|eukprot:CDW86033.1 UNKNOWN [Stylonychia lemnae]